MTKTVQFTIEEKISESTTTSVYRAFDESLRRRVLLKVLHKHLANDADLNARFVREARACAALRSEHIVQVYDLTQMDGAPAIVMEFVEGKSLKEVIAGDKVNTVELTKKTALHVLRGLAVAHGKGIIHRDIKPGNILVSHDGTVKVTDFGLASFALSPTVTMEGMVVGTPAYMAPEQVRGEEIDARTDLFALGATLVEILTGKRIFEGSTYSECMIKVLAFRESELDNIAAPTDPELLQFLKKLMHPKKEERFPSAKEALSVLGEKKSSIFIAPLTSGGSTGRWRLPAFVSVAAVIVFVIVGRMNMSAPSENVDPPAADHASRTMTSPDTQRNGQSEPIVATKREKIVPEKKETSPRSVEQTNVDLPDSGKVFFTSNPWAKVYVNNHLIGETPIARPVLLASGSHTVMFTNPSFEPIVTTVSVEPNKEQTISGNFMEHVGFLHCTIVPWGDIYVDEQYKDTTPMTKPIMISSGKHVVRLKNSAYSDIIKEVNIAAKDTIRLSVTFTQ